MRWKIKWTDSAILDVQSLDRAVQRHILQGPERAAVDPAHFFSKLVCGDEYNLRVGDFRLLAALSNAEQVIIVEHGDHRSRLYRGSDGALS